MNAIIFLSGIGIGGLIASFLFILLVNKLVSQRGKPFNEDWKKYNEASVAALEKRNELGERQADSLKRIAEWCEHNLSLK